MSEVARVDNLILRFCYRAGGHLIRLDEVDYGECGERPERSTLFERKRSMNSTYRVEEVAVTVASPASSS
ncbi:hypothetical protein [Pseudomonas sp. FYR_11]|uniref:hypothetical protein n=1 Tax=Pseudomonas TaxID=286 RepID=UPI00370B18E2